MIIIKLIVGLGNPGKEYEKTRHNIGFWIMDNYLKDKKWSKKFDGLVCEETINNEKIVFLKPMTFMNNSGISVYKAVKYYKFNLDDILIIRDDLDLPFESFKIKFDSSSGGHNGIKSIINYLGNQAFWQFKIGISNDKDNVKDYVLGFFNKSEQDYLDNNDETYNSIIESFICNGGEKTMSIYNKKR